jgi:signal transduction histidine kinase
MKALYKVLRYWDSILALAAGAAGAAWLPVHTIKDVTPELIGFFTIQSAVILPAMIFSAGLLRGDGLTLNEVDRYQAALRRQMSFWVALLSFDLIAAALLVVGKAADWKWKITISGHTENFGLVLIGITVLLSVLAILRMIPFVKGVMSQLELNGLLARKVIEERARQKKQMQQDEPLPALFERPENFGQIIRPKRRRRN